MILAHKISIKPTSNKHPTKLNQQYGCRNEKMHPRSWDRGSIRADLSIGLRGPIAQGPHKIGGTTLADCRMDILVAYIIFLKHLHLWPNNTYQSYLTGFSAFVGKGDPPSPNQGVIPPYQGLIPPPNLENFVLPSLKILH